MGNTILLADKSITIQKIVELTFAEDQFEIKCVNDGQSALDLIPQIKPDIILADISLPVKSGYDICLALRTDPDFSSYSETPVILLAGIYETMDEDRARQVEEKVKEVGANDLLSKPFDPQLLTTKVKDLMIQKSIGTYRSQSAAPTETFSFEVPSTDPALFTDSYENGPSLDDTGNFNAAEEPTDDTEKTMILSVPPFSSEMFAQSPPFEKEEEAIQKNENPVDIDSVKPANEQLFDASDLEAENTPNFFDSSSSSDDSAESLFQSNPEISSTEMQWSDSAFDIVSSEASTEQEQPAHYADYPESNSYSEPSAVPAMDEPFGDVLGEPTVPTVWDSASASDEEVSPFGLPEPQQPNKAVDFGDQTVAYNPHENISDSLPQDSSPAYSRNEPVLDFQEPLAEHVPERFEPEVSWTEPVNSFVEEESVEQDQPAETETEARVENQEPESQQVPYVQDPDEAEELQPDLAEGGFVSEPQVVTPEPSPTPVSAPVNEGQFEITEELIDKIVERVIAKMSLPMLSDIVWQVVPDLAEKMIRRELEKLHTDEE